MPRTGKAPGSCCRARLIPALVLVLLCGLASAARAEAGGPHLVVLQRDVERVPAVLRDEVDRCLLSSISARAGFTSVYASQVPLDEVELAAGCSSKDADCMQRIANTLDADWLLVRELARDNAGRVLLTLIAHDGPTALVTRRAVAPVSDGAAAPARIVPQLVERLYPRGHASAAEGRGWSASELLGWSTAGAGLGLVAAGSVVGALSRSDHRAYGRTEIHSPADVDRAEQLLGRAQQRAGIANGLLIGGAAASVAGAATLLWTYLHPRPEERRVALRISPARSGLSVSLAGAWRGGL